MKQERDDDDEGSDQPNDEDGNFEEDDSIRMPAAAYKD